jgi:addiction module HigA family antidote
MLRGSKMTFTIPNRKPSTPGEILREEFLTPLHLTQQSLAELLNVPKTQIRDLLNDKRPITVDTALRLSKLFGTSSAYWLNLQLMNDLWQARHRKSAVEYRKIRRLQLTE